MCGTVEVHPTLVQCTGRVSSCRLNVLAYPLRYDGTCSVQEASAALNVHWSACARGPTACKGCLKTGATQ